MIKRPIVIMLLSFIAGSMLTSIKVPATFGIIIILLVFIILILYVFKVSNSYLNTLDQFLILLPIFMFLGFSLMNQQEAPHPMNCEFDQKITGDITGTIDNMVDKGDKKVIYLKNNQIKLSKTSKLYQSKNVMIYLTNNPKLQIGNKINVYGEIIKFKPATNLGQFDESKYNKINRIDYKVYAKKVEILNYHYNYFHQGLYEIKMRLIAVYSKILSEKNAGIVTAMLLGEKSMLDTQIKDLYQQNGISHILAISGLHVSLIGLTLYKVLKIIGLNQLCSTFGATLFIYCYGLLTNFSVSTNRAVVMLAVSLFAILIGRTYDLLTATAISALLILFQNPMEIWNAGFLLSFGAILGIGLIAPVLTKLVEEWYLEKIKILKKGKKGGTSKTEKNEKKDKKAIIDKLGIKKRIHNTDNANIIEKAEKKENSYKKLVYQFLRVTMNSFMVCFSVNLITLPILLYYFFELPLYSMIINLLIIPPMSILTWLTIIGGIAGCFSNILGTFFIGGSHYILELYELMCEFFLKLPYHMIVVGKPSFFQIVLYYLFLIIFLILMKHYGKKRCIYILLLLFVIFLRKDPGGLTMTFIDVSQGDGIFLKMPSGTTYLIDGGSSDVQKVGKYRLEPYLKASGMCNIDYAIVTHADSDHTNGLKELCSSTSIKIHHLILPNTSLKDDAYEELISLANSNHIEVIYLEKGDIIKDNEVTMTCLHPENDYNAKTRNGYSTVLSLEYHDFQALFVGDLEEDGENRILEVKDKEGENLLLHYDLLKVAHHGSKYSTQMKFLQKVQPEISIISCGVNNRYGHPHKELIERLEEIESNIFNTMEFGAITVKTDGDRVIVEPYVRPGK